MPSSMLTRARAAGRAVVGIFSEDSARAAWGLLAGALPGGMGTPPARGTAEYLRAYSEMPWLRAISGRIATAVAQSEWQLFVLKGRASKKALDCSGIVKRIQRCPLRAQRMSLLKQAVETDDLTQIPDHPLLDLLNNANEFQTGLGMRKVTQLHLDLVGDAFWLKERGPQNMVTAVWPIPPHWIMAPPTPANRNFRVSFKAWRGLIPDTEFLWFSDDDPLNPYGRGTGIARSLSDELESDEYAAKMTKSYFYNQARPDLLVWPKGQGMAPGETKRLEEDWLSKSGGFWRAFRPYFLSREVEVKELSSMGNFRALQLTQIREAERNVIMQTFGIPPEILGNIENSNRSTIDAAAYLMSRYVVEPRLEFLRSVMQERLVPEFDERLLIEFTSPVQDDHAQQLTAATAAPWSLSMDEWRKMSGRPPMDDPDAGALHMVPTLGKPMTVEQMLEPPPPPPQVVVQPGQPPKPAVPGPPQPPTRAISLTGALSLDVAAAKDAGDDGLADALEKAGDAADNQPEATAVGARHEPGMARALLRAVRDHKARVNLAAVERALEPAGVTGDVMAALQVPALCEVQSAALMPLIQRAFKAGADVGAMVLRRRGVPVKGPSRDGAELASDVFPGVLGSAAVPAKAPGLVLDLQAVNPAAVAWARAHSLLDEPAAVQARVERLIAQSVDGKLTTAQLAKQLRDILGLNDQQAAAVSAFAARLAETGVAAAVAEQRVSRYATAQLRARANAVARTETMSALNRGQQELWTQAVQVNALRKDQFEQVWIITPDDLLCDECEAMTDETAEIGEAFSDGSAGPPEHPNCLPGDALVAAGGRVAAVSQRQYQGEIVIISTASGQQVRCTPNHPVLTHSGWVSARLLHEGDDVIGGRVGKGMSSVHDNDIYIPTRIEQIAETQRIVAPASGSVMVTTAEDFHGDGVDGEVAVIWTDVVLRDRYEATRQQRGAHDALQRRLPRALRNGRRLAAQQVDALATAADGVMRSLHKTIALCAGELRPAPAIAFADSLSACISSRDLSLARGRRGASGPGRTRCDAGASYARQGDRVSADGYAGFANGVFRPSAADAIPSRERLQAFVGQVVPDKILRIERQSFSGHVYNLETEAGWYLANGIITHNCRCTIGLQAKA